MKNIFFFALIGLSLFSCKVAETSIIPRREVLSGLDFREYSQKGFLFTPEKYSGDYESIGLISFLIMPEARKERVSQEEDDSYSFKESPIVYKWNVEEINVQNALDGIYKRSIEMGADALVNFKISNREEPIVNKTSKMVVSFDEKKLQGYLVEGFAIKRK